MLKGFLYLLENYGLGVANLFVIGALAWKFTTNHLKHLNMAIEDLGEKIDKLSDKADERFTETKKDMFSINVKVGKLRERVARIEGKIE